MRPRSCLTTSRSPTRSLRASTLISRRRRRSGSIRRSPRRRTCRSDYKYENFKDIYLYAHEKGLKGCTTFRFNPEAFQGVLVKEDDLKNTTYVFTLEDGSEVEVKGDEEIEYDGEKHTAANLFDAIKEGYYGKL